MSKLEQLSSKKIKVSSKMKLPKVKLDGTETKKAAAKKRGEFVSAFQKSAFSVEKQVSYWLDEALQEATWQWPRPTMRKSGEWVPAGSRNVVDTGKLYKSKKLQTTFGSTQAKLSVSYSAPYAALVHWGGYVMNYGDPTKGQTYMKPRPWIQAVFSTKSDADSGQTDRFGFLEAIKEEMLSQLK